MADQDIVAIRLLINGDTSKNTVFRLPSLLTEERVRSSVEQSVLRFSSIDPSDLSNVAYKTTLADELVYTTLDDIVDNIVRKEAAETFAGDVDKKVLQLHVDVSTRGRPVQDKAQSSTKETPAGITAAEAASNTAAAKPTLKLGATALTFLHKYLDTYNAQTPSGVHALFPSSRPPTLSARYSGFEEPKFWAPGYWAAVLQVHKDCQEPLDAVVAAAEGYLRGSRYPLVRALYELAEDTGKVKASQQVVKQRANYGDTWNQLYKPYADKGTMPDQDPFKQLKPDIQELTSQPHEKQCTKPSSTGSGRKKKAGSNSNSNSKLQSTKENDDCIDDFVDTDPPFGKLRRVQALREQAQEAEQQQQQQGQQKSGAGTGHTKRSKRGQNAAAAADATAAVDLDGAEALSDWDDDAQQPAGRGGHGRSGRGRSGHGRGGRGRGGRGRSAAAPAGAVAGDVDDSEVADAAVALTELASSKQGKGKAGEQTAAVAAMSKALEAAKAKVVKKGKRQASAAHTPQAAATQELYGEEINLDDKPTTAAKQKKAAAVKAQKQLAKEQQQAKAVKKRAADHDAQRSSQYPSRKRIHTQKALAGGA